MITPILPTYGRADLEFESGEGPILITPAGDRYLDFGAGIAVASLGHAHPHLVEALETQAKKLWHTSNLYRIPGQERLAERLVAATFADTVFFTNSGAEALECAIKMARKFHAVNGAPERDELITFEGAFHGRTLATISAGGQEKYLEGFGRRMPGFIQVPMGGLTALKEAIGPNTAGVLLEPIEGEGGIRPWELTALRAILMEHSSASAPEFVKNTVSANVAATRRSASRSCPGIRYRFDVCQSFFACVSNASTRWGWAWPSEATAMPAPKSR